MYTYFDIDLWYTKYLLDPQFSGPILLFTRTLYLQRIFIIMKSTGVLINKQISLHIFRGVLVIDKYSSSIFDKKST